MRTRETLVQVGCFALIGAAVLGAGTLALVKFWQPRTHYLVLYQDVSVTVGPGSLVLFHGEQIGEVVAREYWEDQGKPNVLITVAVEPRWEPQIRRNLIGTIEENFVTGVQNINLRVRQGGDERPAATLAAQAGRDPALQADALEWLFGRAPIQAVDLARINFPSVSREDLSYIHGEPSPFEKLRAQANELQGTMSSIRETAQGIQQLVNVTLEEKIGRFLGSVERVSESIEKGIGRVDTAGQKFEDACDRIIGMIDNSRGDFEGLARNLNEVMAPDGELRTLLRSADGTFQKLGGLIGDQGDLVKLTRTMDDTFRKVGDTLAPDGEFFRLTRTASDTLRSVGDVAGDLHVVLSSQEADLSESLSQLKYSVVGLRQFTDELERDPSSLLLGPRRTGTPGRAFEFRRRE